MTFVRKLIKKVSHRPVAAIALTMLSTFFLFMPLGINAWNAHSTFNQIITRDAQIQHLTDKTAYLDEVLTMSVQMNAATGERQWQERYFEFVPKLDNIIAQINELSPNFYEQEGTAEIKAANDKLVEIEAKALKLAGEGFLVASRNLIDGEEYAAQKEIYTAGVQRSQQALGSRISTARKKFSRSLRTSSAISLISIMVLLPMWLAVLGIIERYLRDLKKERNKTVQLAASLEQRVEQRTADLTNAMRELQQTQSQLVQTEKMSSLGEMMAGIAHEINNPISFIQGNIPALNQCFQELLSLLGLYQKTYSKPTDEICQLREDIEIEFLAEDVPRILSSMDMGTKRVRDIVLSLRNYSRLDEAVVKDVDIHEGIDSTLLILNHRIKQGVEVIKNYGTLPSVICSPSQLNQVFTNIISNALDALFEHHTDTKQIIITTRTLTPEHVQICIRDTGKGMSPDVKKKIFDPFFTTKPVGKGTGLGMGICFKIIEQHQGEIAVETAVGQGTEFIITLPSKLSIPRADTQNKNTYAVAGSRG